jgi:HAD superfamily hydrolase (TIGR01509 family)
MVTDDPLPNPTNPGAVLLDLDGTLVDTVDRRVEAWLAAFAEADIPANRKTVAPLIGSDGRWLARQVGERAGVSLDDDRTEAIDRRAGELFQALNVDPAPLPGARELLLALDATATPWAIATSSRREQVRSSIDALQLPREPMVVDGTHVTHAKPAPDLLLLAAQQLTVAPAAAWCIGDSTFDMQAAVAAGMRAIGVTTGSVGAGTLTASGAAEVVASLGELIPRLASKA